MSLGSKLAEGVRSLGIGGGGPQTGYTPGFSLSAIEAKVRDKKELTAGEKTFYLAEKNITEDQFKKFGTFVPTASERWPGEGSGEKWANQNPQFADFMADYYGFTGDVAKDLKQDIMHGGTIAPQGEVIYEEKFGDNNFWGNIVEDKIWSGITDPLGAIKTNIESVKDEPMNLWGPAAALAPGLAGLAGAGWGTAAAGAGGLPGAFEEETGQSTGEPDIDPGQSIGEPDPGPDEYADITDELPIDEYADIGDEPPIDEYADIGYEPPISTENYNKDGSLITYDVQGNPTGDIERDSSGNVITYDAEGEKKSGTGVSVGYEGGGTEGGGTDINGESGESFWSVNKDWLIPLGFGTVGSFMDYLGQKESSKAELEAFKLGLVQQEKFHKSYTESLTPESRFTEGQLGAQGQWRDQINAQLSQGAGYQGPDSPLGRQMAAAQQAIFGRQQGEMLGNIGQQRQTSQTALGGAMRGLYGNATPGLQAQMGSQLEQSFAGPTLAARMMPGQAMQQWKAGQAQQGLQNLQSYAQAPLGNLPQGYTEPLFPPTDYSGAAGYNALGNMFNTGLQGWMMNSMNPYSS